MQKLNSYAQSPRQDIRSFCSEMRKLFQEIDLQMSSTMKLELLLAKVNPSYRLDLLKQKPKDLENTYLAFQAMGENTQGIALFPSEAPPSPSDILPYSSSHLYQSTPYNNYNDINYRNDNTSRSNLRFPTNINRSPWYSSSNSSYGYNQASSRQSFSNQNRRATYNPHRNSRRHLSAYQPPFSQKQPLPSHSIPPLMSSTPSVPKNQQHQEQSSQQTLTLVCQ